MSLASMYPSATGGSGVTSSPLSVPAPAEAPIAPAATVASPDPQTPAAEAPAQPAALSEDDAELDALIDAAVKPAEGEAATEGEAEALEPDLTVDERKDFFANVRSSEPAPTSAMDYAPVVRFPGGVKPGEGFDAAMHAAAKAGVGITEMQGFFGAFADAARDPIKTTPEGAAAALQAEFGDRYEAKLASGKALLDRFERSGWTNVREWLAVSGLGNDPRFARRLIARAEKLCL